MSYSYYNVKRRTPKGQYYHQTDAMIRWSLSNLQAKEIANENLSVMRFVGLRFEGQVLVHSSFCCFCSLIS